jgi:aspartate 1-decarboxylase
MLRSVLHAKIHRATITDASLDYVGSMTIPRQLMSELDILDGEEVLVANVTNGQRWTTYAIPGDRPDGFCLNGAAARYGQPGDLIIIMIFAQMDLTEARKHKAKVAFMGPDNRVERIAEHPHA